MAALWQVLRSCRFNVSHGWEHVGTTPLEVTGHTSSFLARRQPWDFGGAGTEQGFMFYMLFVRHAVGAYGARDRQLLPISRHWWSGEKPWMHARVNEETAISWGLARTYDYLLRESVEWHGARPATPTPKLVAQLRAQRQAIENHPHFDDLCHIWQASNRDGDGFAYLVTLPVPQTALSAPLA